MIERSVLDDAIELTRGDRNRDYGHPSDDYERTAAMWSAFLGHPVTARQAMGCMILVKMSRLAHTPDHWDSAVDIAGYADCIGRDIERERLTAGKADLEACPYADQHWPGIPQSYDEYGPWYLGMTRTHSLHQCAGCGQYVIWTPLEQPLKTAGQQPSEMRVWENTMGLTRRGGDL